MGSTNINPDADLGGYPLISVVTGAATRWQALSDSNDSTYVAQETSNPVDGVDIIGLGNPSIPAGAVATGGIINGRVRHDQFNVAYDFFLRAEPKAQYKSPWAPYAWADCFTALGADRMAWWFLNAEGAVGEWAVTTHSTWAYDTGFGFVHYTWDKMDLNTMSIIYKYSTPFTDENRIYKLYVSVVYNTVPTVTSIAPSGLVSGEIATTAPIINWTYGDTEGNPQSQYRVIIVRSDARDTSGRLPGAANYNPEAALETAYDSGTVLASTPNHQVGPIGLDNLVNYYAYVRVWHAAVNGIEMKSNWGASASFLVDAPVPDDPTIGAVANNTFGRIEVDVYEGDWNSTPKTAYLELQRNVNGAGWVPTRNGTAVTLRDGIRTGSSTSNQITTPSHSSLDITGDIAIKALVALEGAVGDHYILSKMHLSLGNAWQFKTDTTGKLRFTFNKSGVLTDAVSPNAIPFPSAKTPFWVMMHHVSASNWNTTFYYSLDPPDTDPSEVNWTSLGTFVGSGSGAITNASISTHINGYGLVGQSTFRVYMVELFNSFGVLVANPDFRNTAFGSSSYTDGPGRVWTINLGTPNMNRGFITRYDYEMHEGENVRYRTQATALDSGVPVAGAWLATADVQLALSDHTWWFKVVGTETLNTKFDLLPSSWDAHVPADAAAFSPLGRTRKVVVSDGTKGAEQTLLVECMSIEQYEALRSIYEAQQVVYVVTHDQSRYLAFIDWTDDRHTLTNGYSVVALKAIEVDSPVI